MESRHPLFVPPNAASSYGSYFDGETAAPTDMSQMSDQVSGLTLDSDAVATSVSSSSFPAITSQQSSAVAAAAASAAGDHGTMFLENVGGTTYFYTAEEATHSTPEPTTLPPACLVYSGTPAHVLVGRTASVGARPSPSVAAGGFSCSESTRQLVYTEQRALLTTPNSPALPHLPAQLDNYTQLLPLDASDAFSRAGSGSGQFTCYKAVSIKSGLCFCLRRLHNCNLSAAHCSGVATAWAKLAHANIVAVRDVFPTTSFGDNSVIVVQDYHPVAECFADVYFDQPSDVNGFSDPFQDPNIPRPYSAQKTAVQRQQKSLLPEATVWSYVVQLTAAVRAIHSAGLACGGALLPQSVIVTDGETRPRLVECGVSDILDGAASTSSTLAVRQQQDLTALGRLLLALSCNSLSALLPDKTGTALSIVAHHFSTDLKALLVNLLTPAGSCSRQRSINDVMPMIGARFYVQLETAQTRVYGLEHELSLELASGRLLRLLAQLSAVTERPQLNGDSSWADTSDRYLLSLFRDHVFHAVTSTGTACPDLSHIVHCLNRLDVGSGEQVSLYSRDSPNVLVTSYGELKQCLDRSFSEVHNASLPKETLTQ